MEISLGKINKNQQESAMFELLISFVPFIIMIALSIGGFLFTQKYEMS